MLDKPKNGSQAKLGASIPDVWGLLRTFWNTARVTRWKKEISPDPNNPSTSLDDCFNLISLSAYEHAMWKKGLFALKPLALSDDKKQLTLQFFLAASIRSQA